MFTGISRRRFITVAAMGVGTYALWRWGGPFVAEDFDPRFIVGDYDRREDARGRIGLVSANAELLKSWTIPLKAHSAWQNKARPWQIMAVEKDGSLAAVIDLHNESAPPRYIKAPEGSRFYGHGFFSADGSLIYLCVQQAKRKGSVFVYDSISFNLLSQIDSRGYRPHDMQVDIQNPNQFLIANAGTPEQEANISWFSLASGNLEKQISLDKPGYSPAHIWQRPSGEIYFTGADTKVNVEDETISFSVYKPGKDVLEVVSPAWGVTLKGETLNAFTDDANNRIWLTSTVSDRILIVDKTNFKLLQMIKVIERPRSMIEINVEGKRVLSVSYYIKGTDLAAQKFFDLQNFEEIKNISTKKHEFYSIHSYPFHPMKKA